MIRDVSYGGRHDGTQANVAIGLEDGRNGFGGYDRNVGKEFISGGGAVLEHLDSPEGDRDVLILGTSLVGQRGKLKQPGLQRPIVDKSFEQVLTAVGVGIDEARNDKMPGRIEDLRVGRRGKVAPDFRDQRSIEEDVQRTRFVVGRREDQAVLNPQGHAALSGAASGRCNRSVLSASTSKATVRDP